VTEDDLTVSSSFTTGAMQIAVKYTSGTTGILSLATNSAATEAYIYNPNTSSTATLDLTSAATTVAEGWYSYTLNSDGSVNLSNVNTDYTDVVASGDSVYTTYNSSTVGIGTTELTATSKLATSSTVLSVVSSGTLTTYTGYSNFTGADYTAASGINILVVYTSSSELQIAKIFVVGSTVSTTYTYGVITSVGGTSSDGVAYNLLLSDGTTDTVYSTVSGLAAFDVVQVTTTSSGTTLTEKTATASGEVVNYVDSDSAYFTLDSATTVAIPMSSTCIVYSASDYYSSTTLAVDDTITYYLNSSGYCYAIVITAHA
jgi:hypothetical protein